MVKSRILDRLSWREDRSEGLAWLGSAFGSIDLGLYSLGITEAVQAAYWLGGGTGHPAIAGGLAGVAVVFYLFSGVMALQWAWMKWLASPLTNAVGLTGGSSDE